MRFTHPCLLATLATMAACADPPVAPTRLAVPAPAFQQSEGRGVFQRYVAIGTSLSMGWASDGVNRVLQEGSWPAQLARMGHREITQPYIQNPGCPAPIAPPLGAAKRINDEPALADPASLSCAPLVSGVTLPTQNVAVNGARTADALFTTPENAPDAVSRRLYSRVLPPGATQVTAMLAQHPKLVSVELGANEVFAVRSGVALVGPAPLPILDPQIWAPLYRQVLDNVEASTAKHVLLVGLPSNPFLVPGFRFGSEIAANAGPLLAAFNVAVQSDCTTTNSGNLIFVTLKLTMTIQAGLIARAANQGPVPFSCAADANPAAVDFVLSQEEQAVIADVVARMNAVIAGEASARGWAYFTLDALYAAPGVRTPLDVVALMTSAQPFGPFMGLDGVHPNAAGQQLIAEAAAQALNQRYELGIPIL